MATQTILLPAATMARAYPGVGADDDAQHLKNTPRDLHLVRCRGEQSTPCHPTTPVDTEEQSAVRPHRPGRSAMIVAGLLLMICSIGTATAQMDLPELGHILTPVEPRVAAPDFALESLDGHRLALADLKGRVVMLNFWATWCPPCRREMPSMDELHRALSERPFSVVAINEWEEPDQVFAWIGVLPRFPAFPILFDPDGAVAEAYGVKGLPTTFVIDREGRIAYRAMGGREFNHPEVVRLIESLLAP